MNIIYKTAMVNTVNLQFVSFYLCWQFLSQMFQVSLKNLKGNSLRLRPRQSQGSSTDEEEYKQLEEATTRLAVYKAIYF